MKTKELHFETIILLVLFFCTKIGFSQTTYTVTSTSKDGAGSFNQAVLDANSNPGADIIEFSPGLQVDAAHVFFAGGSGSYMSTIQESVTIDGKGGAINGRQKWISASGVINDLSGCPGNTTGTSILAAMPNFMEVSAGITVTVKNLSIKQFNSIAIIRDNATLNLDNFTAEEIRSTIGCNAKGLFTVNEGANLAIKDSKFLESYNWASAGSGTAIATSSSAGNLTIESSVFYSIEGGEQFLISWEGAPTSEVNIVSSRILGSGGIAIGSSTSETNIVNSTMVNRDTSTPRFGDRIINGSSGPINVIASSIKWNSNKCAAICPISSQILIQSLNGQINFLESAIGFNFTDNTGTLLATLGGTGAGFTADVNTWIEPTPNQDASALQTITSQPSLITGTPGFKSPVITQIAYNDAELVSPDISGVLIDIVNTPLINPIDSNPITEDILGNERFDANGFRDIGALQLSLAPILTVSGSGDEFVDLAWQEPLHHDGDPIVRYEYQYVDTSGGSPVLVDAGLSLIANVTGLTNGTTYEFTVRAVYNEPGGDVNGPFGNVEIVTPVTGEIAIPTVSATPGDSQVSVSWTLPDLGGRNFSSYIILWKEVGSASLLGGQSITDVGTTTTSITGLTNDTEYEFSVAVIATNNDRSEYGIAIATPFNTLGVDENALNLKSIVMYPNPANNIVTLSNPRQLELSDVTIYDSTGRIMSKVDLRNMRSEITVDISNLANSAYLLVIKGSQGTLTKTLIVNKY